MEEPREVKVFIVDMRCDECANGYMQFTSKNIYYSETVFCPSL